MFICILPKCFTSLYRYVRLKTNYIPCEKDGGKIDMPIVKHKNCRLLYILLVNSTAKNANFHGNTLPTRLVYKKLTFQNKFQKQA